MKENFGVFLPISNKQAVHKVEMIMNVPFKRPFFNIFKDEGVVQNFLEAVKKQQIDDAKIYLSKRFKAGNLMNLDELKNLLDDYGKYKYLRNNVSATDYENFRINSILIMNNEYKNSILHLYLIKEPDKYGNWKIYGIERE